MKKILTIFLACLSLLMCVFMGAGCSSVKPQLDLKDAAEALEENGYDVELENYHGYDFEDYFGYYSMVVDKSLWAEDEDGDEWISIYEFESVSMAKSYYKKYKQECEAYIAEQKAELKFMKKILKEYEDDMKSSEIDNLEDKIKEQEEKLEREKERLKASGCSGKFFWKASSERALRDTK